MIDFLNEREEAVLKTIIDQYVSSSEPVGSRHVSQSGPLRMSPASIRNIMSDLEEKGMIEQPHTSAGRIPTDRGYRYYIDRLVRFDAANVDNSLREQLSCVTSGSQGGVQDIFREFGKKIGALTGSVGFVISPRVNTLYLKQIEFLRLSRVKALAILVTRTGIVHNVLLDIEPSVTDSELTMIGNYLTEQCRSRTVDEVRSALIEQMNQNRTLFNAGLSKVMTTGLGVLSRNASQESLFIEGTANMLAAPEFQDVSRLKNVFEAFEEKRMMLDILDRCLRQDGVQIFVGSEIGVDKTESLGLVISPYSRRGNIVGMVGVIGPKRMHYPKVVPVVDYSARLLSGFLNEFFEGTHE